MDDRKLQFKCFITNSTFADIRSFQKEIAQYFDDYTNIELISQSQSQSTKYLTLCIFFKADMKEPEE